MRGFFILLFFLEFITVSAQTPSELKPEKNLVPNGSFENYRKKSSDVRKAIPWRQIESVDYYQNPLDNDTTVQKGAYD